MNLSSSTPEKKHEDAGIFSGIFTVVLLFVLILALWGGMRWYISTLDDKLAEQKILLEENASQLKGENVDRVASFDARLTLMKERLADTPVNSQALLNQLESLVVPNVKLTKYEFNKKEKFVIVDGETDNFKYVAQQLINLKGEAPFTGISVTSLKKSPEGRILFSFKAELN